MNARGFTIAFHFAFSLSFLIFTPLHVIDTTNHSCGFPNLSVIYNTSLCALECPWKKRIIFDMIARLFCCPGYPIVWRLGRGMSWRAGLSLSP